MVEQHNLHPPRLCATPLLEKPSTIFGEMSATHLLCLWALAMTAACDARECDWWGTCKPKTFGESVGEFISTLCYTLVCLLILASVVSCLPGMIKGVALAAVIIGAILSCTGIGAIIGFPMIVGGSIALCCCMNRPQQHMIVHRVQADNVEIPRVQW